MRTTNFIILFILFFTELLLCDNKLSRGEHFAEVNNIKIHYFVEGKGPVCLVPSPGWGPSVSYLKNSLAPFEKFFTMVYYDTRMSGLSTGPDDPFQYTSVHYLNDMESLRVYLGKEKVWLMGHSAGGFQVLYYGIHYSDKLYGIIAIDAIAGHDSLYYSEYKKIILKRSNEAYFEKGSRLLLHKNSFECSWEERLLLTLPFYFHDPTKIYELLKLDEIKISAKAQRYSETSKFGLEYIFTELNKIDVPTLIVVGDDDFVCNKVSQADRITKLIKNSTEIVIKNAGHFPWIEQPKQFFNECFEWLKKQGLKERN
ncbi:MAG: alpha/beta hydrolase [Melioribacter sp.]|nr:alpha/beta hydrolase [Melioribacter sp.]